MAFLAAANDFDKKYCILDTITPRHTILSARYKRSYAYYTMREVLPVILTQILDNLTKDKDEIADQRDRESTREEIKEIVGQISKLKYQLQTDKNFEPFVGHEPDGKEWNKFLKSLDEDSSSFYKSAWLYAECYMYRKVASFFENSKTLSDYDYFSKQKERCLADYNKEVIALAKRLRNTEKDFTTFSRLLKVNLWGNKLDLAAALKNLSLNPSDNLIDHGAALDDRILVDNCKYIWECLVNADKSKKVIVDIVTCHAGFEMFTDFALADYMLEKNLAKVVRFHVKARPWYIYEVMTHDFNHVIDTLCNSTNNYVSDLGRKWKNHLMAGNFLLAPLHYFWISPYEYFKMREVEPELYKYLRKATLVIFKGNVNYRKLLGDMNWDPTDDFLTTLRGFLPTNICALRTIKADLVCGLAQGKAEELTRHNHKWMQNGEYGLIQFMDSACCDCQVDEES